MGHWIEGLVRTAGIPGAESFTCSRNADVQRAWGEAKAACHVDSQTLSALVARVYHLDQADLTSAEPTAARLLPEALVRKYGVFPLHDRDRFLDVATSDPVDVQAEQEIGFASGRTPRLMVAPPEDILDAIDATYSADRAAERLLSTLDDAVGEMEILGEVAPEPTSAEEVGSGPVVRLANIILSTAITQRASDIHVQPRAAGGVVRYRVDGVLRTAMQMPMNILTRVISRLKVLGRMDIADRIRPQDGRARVLVDGVEYDLRISTVPARGAEKVVIRILDSQGSQVLDDIGMAPQEVDRIRRLLSRRDGIFVVTGPTGSGKTSTLYAALREISTDDVNIMTVEDPVEYVLPGLTQIQVEVKQGVTFASALRAILRQDPDVVFIGEIRDEETAAIAAQASLTGHLVLATLHTNDAVGAIRRFLDLRLEIPTLCETLRGALAQRLVRRVCPSCALPVNGHLTEEESTLAQRYAVRPSVRAVGCEACQDQGYKGRVPVTELLTMTPALNRLIASGAQAADLNAQAKADGMKPLLESALDLVRAGVTTLQEVERVLGEDEPPPQTPVGFPPPEPDDDAPPPEPMELALPAGTYGLVRPEAPVTKATRMGPEPSWWTTTRPIGPSPRPSFPGRGTRSPRPPTGVRRW